MADAHGKSGHFAIGDIQDTFFSPQCLQLLLLKRDAIRQRRDMPVNVPVPLLAAQGEDVDAFRFHAAPDGLRDLIYRLLKSQIFLERELSGDLFPVLNWRHQNIPIQNRNLVEEDNEFIILINDMVTIQPARDHLTNKTGIVLNLLSVVSPQLNVES